jgi:hypothetical protein
VDDVPACQNYHIVPFASENMVLIGLRGFVNDCHCDVIVHQDMVACCATTSGCTFEILHWLL